VAPKDEACVSRQYRHGTLILVTRFDTAGGSVELTDLMPLGLATSHVVRLVHGTSGSVTISSEMAQRFEYGSAVPWVEALDDGTIRAICGPEMVLLCSPVRHHGEDHTTVADFTVRAGDCIPFVLSYCPSHQPLGPWLDPQKALQDTEAAWRAWSDRCAPWLRDATFTLLALGGAGYAEEARAWRDWLMRAVAGSPEQMQIMYGIAGERRLPEWEATWLQGFETANPVRIGNAAASP